MADPEKTGSPTKATAGSNPESPTTARPLDFDDEPQETGVTSAGTPSRLNPTVQSDPEDGVPAKPPRPLSPQQEAENTLREAFPSLDAAVVKAVLVASGGNVEPAFNALLGMSDPNSQVEIPPTKPPRPSPMAPTSTAQSQLEADEMYARQLAEHYGGSSRGGAQRSSRKHDPRMQRPRQETGLNPNELYDDREHSFFDDDLPVIRENIRKGFLETQTKVNSWVQNFKKKLDGEEDEDYYDDGPRQSQGYAQGYGEAQTYRTRRSGDARRSGDRDRYDADPQVLGDDFSALELRDAEAAPRRSTRPQANPDLFKSTSPAPEKRRVSFQDGPPEEINDTFLSGPDPNKRSSSTGSKSSKWQPLSAVEPSPVGETDFFSLGDSDDEKDAKNKELKADEKKGASETATTDTSKIGDTSADKS